MSFQVVLPRLVALVSYDGTVYRMCCQVKYSNNTFKKWFVWQRVKYQVDRPVCDCTCRPLHDRRPLGEIWRLEDERCKSHLVNDIALWLTGIVIVAGSSQTLGCSYRMSHHLAYTCLHDLLQASLPRPQSLRPWWCTNEFTIPGQLGWLQLCFRRLKKL